MPDASSDSRRIVFPNMLTERGLLGEGVELGVFTGWHSNLILENWAGKKLWGVDSYRPVPQIRDGHDVNQTNFTPARWERIKATADRVFEKHGTRAELLHMDTYDASLRFDDGSLDWVYIDAGHYREAVAMDIDTWLPKIKKGGILAGHDYYDGGEKCRVEVKEVVDTLFGDRVGVWDTGEIPTWYVLL